MYQLFYFLKMYSPLSVLHYVTVRAGLSLIASFLISLFLGKKFIAFSKNNFASKAREHTPKTHRAKDFTPTMGGLFILAVVVLNIIFWTDLACLSIWIFLYTFFGFGMIGAWDDWCKIKKQSGISARTKLFLQLFVAVVAMSTWVFLGDALTTVHIPFFKSVAPDIGNWFILWGVFLIVGCSNAVNLTDGLDGLAISSLIFNFAIFSAMSYVAGHLLLATYLFIPYAGTAEFAVVGCILTGATLGFLWFNAYPAEIFMGDVGSLSLGAALALLALMTKQEFVLAITGGLFVIETISVVLQVFSVRMYKKRIFKMAPIHHHFELLGWHESKVVMRFSIITFILCLLGLLTLKLR